MKSPRSLTATVSTKLMQRHLLLISHKIAFSSHSQAVQLNNMQISQSPRSSPPFCSTIHTDLIPMWTPCKQEHQESRHQPLVENPDTNTKARAHTHTHIHTHTQTQTHAERETPSHQNHQACDLTECLHVCTPLHADHRYCILS